MVIIEQVMCHTPKVAFLSTLGEFRKSAEKWLTKGMGSRKCLQKADGFVGEKWDQT